MQKTKYFACFYHTILFFSSKRCQVKLNTLFDYKNNEKRELENIAWNHSADFDYKGFVKIYRECTK